MGNVLFGLLSVVFYYLASARETRYFDVLPVGFFSLIYIDEPKVRQGQDVQHFACAWMRMMSRPQYSVICVHCQRYLLQSNGLFGHSMLIERILLLALQHRLPPHIAVQILPSPKHGTGCNCSDTF